MVVIAQIGNAMPNIERIQCRWTGFVGSPGYTNFYFLTGAIDSVGKVKAFFTAVSGQLAGTVRVTIPNEGETFEATTGELVGTWTRDGGGEVAGGGGGGYAAPAGVVINWKTGSINRGKKVRGKTFLVPCGGNALDGFGSLQDASLVALRAAATGLVTDTSPYFVTWSRPRLGAGGMAAPILSATVPDFVAVLRSRRD